MVISVCPASKRPDNTYQEGSKRRIYKWPETNFLLNDVFVLDTDGDALWAHIFGWRDAGHSLQGNVHQTNDEDQDAGEETEPQRSVYAGADKRIKNASSDKGKEEQAIRVGLARNTEFE